MPDPRNGEWETPWDFVRRVEHTLRVRFILDLAAKKHNAKADVYIVGDSFKTDWLQVWKGLSEPGEGFGKAAWLNPPFANIDPWVRKAIKESCQGVPVVMLLPDRQTKWRKRLEDVDAEIWDAGRISFGGMKGPGYTDSILVRLHPPVPGVIRRVTFPGHIPARWP